MEVTLRDFLGASYNHGYITIKSSFGLNPILWEGNYETINNHIDWEIYNEKVTKWGIENNGIVIYVTYNKSEE